VIDIAIITYDHLIVDHNTTIMSNVQPWSNARVVRYRYPISQTTAMKDCPAHVIAGTPNQAFPPKMIGKTHPEAIFEAWGKKVSLDE
jgi:hypothetical protein